MDFISDDKSYFNICTVMQTQLMGFCDEFVCRQPGVEILLPPYPVRELKVGNRQIAKFPAVSIPFSGALEHRERFHNCSGRVVSLVISPRFLDRLLEPIDGNWMGLEFDYRLDHLPLNSAFRIARRWLGVVNDLSDGSASSALADCQLSELFFELLLIWPNSYSQNIKTALGTGHFPSHLTKIKKIMAEHLVDPEFDLDALCAQAGMSKFHLIREFRMQTGLSPMRYYNCLRIDLARKKLRTTQQPISALAFDLGFDDISTFNKLFKRTTGMVPRFYRHFFRC
ncbi:MAG: helix-turn-helix transcriptional regulator [Deltaproteobacteria bacterium]|nr:helix-turn-helix transcriptional regulator [Deltaproteobacteria bacterium]